MAFVRSSTKSGTFLRAGGRRRETQWLEIEATVAAFAAPSTAVLLASMTAAELALRPFTVVRSRGALMMVLDQVAASERQVWDFGLAVVSDQAVAVGVTAVPTPSTDRASDLWFVYESLMSEFEFVSGVGFDQRPGDRKDFDSKAMRKVVEGDQIIVVGETAAISDGVIATVVGRVLVKLH